MNKRYLTVLLGGLLLAVSGCNQKEIAELRDQTNAASEQIQATNEAHSASIESLQQQLRQSEAKAADLATSLDKATTAHSQTVAKLNESAAIIESISKELGETRKSLNKELETNRVQQQSATEQIATLQKELAAINLHLKEQQSQTTTLAKELKTQFDELKISTDKQLADERKIRQDMAKQYEAALADKTKALNLVQLTAKAIGESSRVRARAERDLATLAGLETEILEHLGKLAGTEDDPVQSVAQLPQQPVAKEVSPGAKVEPTASDQRADLPVATDPADAAIPVEPNKAVPPVEPQQDEAEATSPAKQKPTTETLPTTPSTVEEEPQPTKAKKVKPAPAGSNQGEPSDSSKESTPDDDRPEKDNAANDEASSEN